VTATTATTVAEPAAEPDDDPDDPDGGPDWEPWDPTDDPDSDQIWQAINRTGQRTLTESGSDSDGGRTVPRSLIPEGLRVDELPSDRRRTAAHQILADVDHPHRDTLAATHGMSARWWVDRIAEVRGSRAAGEVPLWQAHGSACHGGTSTDVHTRHANRGVPMGLFSFSDDREPDATRAPNSDPDKDETTINERGQVRRVEH